MSDSIEKKDSEEVDTTETDEKSKILHIPITSNVSEDVSLQESFKKFLDQRKREIKLDKSNKDSARNQVLNNIRSDADKLELRHRFIEQAKKYIGVPYSVRFKPKDEPVAPLYLDCCGLIRQVLLDLKVPFGFTIGQWNQAYQFDTLPPYLPPSTSIPTSTTSNNITTDPSLSTLPSSVSLPHMTDPFSSPTLITHINQLQPGDLIFYEGTYNRPNARPQKHNMVHVEIFLGEGDKGESTIGSRMRTGKVSFFDSYKFDSANWTLIRHHYRSINTWLNGICESICTEHPWLNYVSSMSGRKSIFYDSDDEEADTHHDIDEEEHNEEGGKGKDGNKNGSHSSNIDIHHVSDSNHQHRNDANYKNKNEEENDEDEEQHVDDDYIYEESVTSVNNITAHDDVTNHTTTPITDATLEVDGIAAKVPTLSLTDSHSRSHSPRTHSDSTVSLTSVDIHKSDSDNNKKNTSSSIIMSKTDADISTSTGNNSTATAMKSSSSAVVTVTNTSGNSVHKKEKRISSARDALITSATPPISTGISSTTAGAIVNTHSPTRPPRLHKTDSSAIIPSGNSSSDISNSIVSGTTTGSVRLTSTLISNNLSSNNTHGLTYYVNKSNGWKLVKVALDKRGWTQLPFTDATAKSTKYGFKWVQQRCQIDYRSHVSGQLVNHIANNDVICSKLSLLLTLRDKFCRGSGSAVSNSNSNVMGGSNHSHNSARNSSPSRNTSNPTATNSNNANNLNNSNSNRSPSPNRTGNNSNRITHNNNSSSGSLPTPRSKRVSGTSSNNDSKDVTGTSTTLETPLSSMAASSAVSSSSTAVEKSSFEKSTIVGYISPRVRIPTPWVPETFEIDSTLDTQTAIQLEQQELSRTGNKTGLIWIYKPACNNRGRGIQVFTGLELLEEICYGSKKKVGKIEKSDKIEEPGNKIEEVFTPPRKGGILQIYIQKPLLIHVNDKNGGSSDPSGGFKFDIRCYMLIARTLPYMVFYHPGYCRLTLKPYSLDLDTLHDSTIHLTNAAIQKQDPLYYDNKEFQIQTVSAVADLIEKSTHGDEEKNKSAANYLRNKVDHDIKKCMVDVLKACTHRLLKKHGYFDLYGFDFMVTEEENKLMLIEINTNPALSLDNSTLENLLPGVIDGAIELVLATQGPNRPVPSAENQHSKERDREILARLPGQYQLLYDEANNSMYT